MQRALVVTLLIISVVSLYCGSAYGQRASQCRAYEFAELQTFSKVELETLYCKFQGTEKTGVDASARTMELAIRAAQLSVDAARIGDQRGQVTASRKTEELEREAALYRQDAAACREESDRVMRLIRKVDTGFTPKCVTQATASGPVQLRNDDPANIAVQSVVAQDLPIYNGWWSPDCSSDKSSAVRYNATNGTYPIIATLHFSSSSDGRPVAPSLVVNYLRVETVATSKYKLYTESKTGGEDYVVLLFEGEKYRPTDAFIGGKQTIKDGKILSSGRDTPTFQRCQSLSAVARRFQGQ